MTQTKFIPALRRGDRVRLTPAHRQHLLEYKGWNVKTATIACFNWPMNTQACLTSGRKMWWANLDCIECPEVTS